MLFTPWAVRTHTAWVDVGQATELCTSTEAEGRTDGGPNDVMNFPNSIDESRSDSDVVVPIKPRACHALHLTHRTVLESPRPVSGVRVMQRGVERC